MLITLLLKIAYWVLAIPATIWCSYLILLTLLSRKSPEPKASSHKSKFDIVIPAHNEEQIIARTIASLRQIDWPKDQYRLIVIADNCTDSTAAVAASNGALVWERRNLQLRGKGYALEHAFRLSMEEAWAEAIVVVDADSEVSKNLLEAFAARIEAGESAVQVDYGVLNPNASWRTRLMTIALSAFHIVRSRARERLKVSCGIRGNGWCIKHDLLKQVPYNAYSLAEDIEYGIALGMAGHRIAYADESHVYGEMVSQEHASRNQRRRWEDGRFQLMWSQSFPLLFAALKSRSRICFDLAMDLLVLPLSYIALCAGLMFVLAIFSAWSAPFASALVWLAIANLLGIVVYVMRGWHLSGTGIAGLKDLARAPGFLLWKIWLVARSKSPSGWIRTDRETR